MNDYTVVGQSLNKLCHCVRRAGGVKHKKFGFNNNELIKYIWYYAVEGIEKLTFQAFGIHHKLVVYILGGHCNKFFESSTKQ